MIEFLQNLDTDTFLALHNVRAQFLDPYVRAFSGKGIWVALYLAIAYAVIRQCGWKRGLLMLAAIGVAVGCSDAICAHVIRPAVERLRPSNPDNPISAMVHLVNGYKGGGKYGFPSCHATNTFALAVASSLTLRRRWYGAFIFAWAVLQCWSRIYLGVHYPGDILVGAIVGTIMGVAAIYAVRVGFKYTPAPCPTRTAIVPIAVGLLSFVAVAIKAYF